MKRKKRYGDKLANLFCGTEKKNGKLKFAKIKKRSKKEIDGRRNCLRRRPLIPKLPRWERRFYLNKMKKI